MKLQDLKEKHLKKAIQIYDKILYNSEPPPHQIEDLIYSVNEQIDEYGWAYARSRFPNWKHARMQIGSPNNEKYYYSIDTNDDNPNMEEIRKENLEYKIKIESEWKNAGIPTE